MTHCGVSAARKVIQQHWNGDIPVDVVMLSSQCGLPVYWAGSNTDCVAELVTLDSGQRAMMLRKTEPLVRQRYAVAHALGAFLTGSKQTVFNVADYASTVKSDANAFAVELLMPKEALDLAISLYTNIEQLANQMQVSEVALYNRLKSLRIV